MSAAPYWVDAHTTLYHGDEAGNAALAARRERALRGDFAAVLGPQIVWNRDMGRRRYIVWFIAGAAVGIWAVIGLDQFTRRR